MAWLLYETDSVSIEAYHERRLATDGLRLAVTPSVTPVKPPPVASRKSRVAGPAAPVSY
jgi:hypothetical protein